MKTFTILAMVLMALLPVEKCFPQPVTIGAEDGVGLWGSKTGGCGNDLVAAAIKASNFTVQLAIVPYNRAKALALEGTYAGCFSMIREKELEGRIVFSTEPLYRARAIAIQQRSKERIAADLSGLRRGTTIGITRGYEYDFSIADLKGKGIIVVETNSEENSLQMLNVGRLDVAFVYVDELKSLASILKNTSINPKSVVVAFEQSATEVFVGFSLANPHGLVAKQKFDLGFSLIKKNGRYESILQKWKQKA